MLLSLGDECERDLEDECKYDHVLSCLQAHDTVKNIVSLCNGIPHKKILEIGCGGGAVLSRLSKVNFADCIYGLDKLKRCVEITNSKNIKSLVKCEVFDTDELKQFPYGDNKFDLAILSHVVEHVKHPRALLGYAGKAARYVFIEIPLEDNLCLKKDYDDRDEHKNVYSYKTIRWLIQTSDFKIIEHKITIPSLAVYLHRYELEPKVLRAGWYIPPKLARWQFIRRRATLIFDCYNSSILCKRC